MNLTHIAAISDHMGIFEHCLYDKPRTEHGYCVDDVARALIVVERAPASDVLATCLAPTYAAFLANSQTEDGKVTNRRSASGAWCGSSSTEDHWGRALWAWGVSAHRSTDATRASASLKHFERSAQQRSPFLRSMMFAALGACEVLEGIPTHRVARALLQDALAMLPPDTRSRWPWPESRLTYANAVIPEVMMLGGAILGDSTMVRRGKSLLLWLLDVQSVAGRLSLVPHTGWAIGEPLPTFDQQPIEVAALVDACATAYDLTSDQIWREFALVGRRWFEGHNDKGIAMYDPATGAGFDALTQSGRNENQGAESTLAHVSTFQRTKHLLQAAA